MPYTSRSISISYSKYSETSIIAKLFTKKNGLQSFIIRGVRKKKSKNKLGFFQPLQLSEITASLSKRKNLQTLHDICLTNVKLKKMISTRNDLIAVFVAEVLSKILHEGEADDKLFEYIWNVKLLLNDETPVDLNFPLLFLLQLSNFLGFSPLKENLLNIYFNIEQGCFVNKKSNMTLTQENSLYLKALLNKNKIHIPYKNRNQLLEILIKYYKFHDHELKNLTSHIIIESLRS